ncbi:MAG: tetratricopeptide repeat protein [Candidatus Peribacteraceae bacterium]
MKISPRVTIPAVIALAMSGVIGALFLWQIRSSISTIESSFRVQNIGTSFLRKLLPSPTPERPDSASQSEALLRLRQGEIFELKGEWKQAEDLYTRSIAAGGGAPALRRLASIQLQRREYSAAKQTIERLKEENRESSDVLLFEGLLALRSGDISGAQFIFRRKPSAPQAQFGLSLVEVAQGDYEQAKEELTKASQGSDPTIRMYAGILLQAFSEFALFPEGQEIHLRTLLARALAQVKECEIALPLLNTVIAEQPRYRDAWIIKGYCEFTSERLKDALASLEQAYTLDPEKPETQYFLARAYAALGDPQNAVTFLQYALLNGFSPEKDARELLAEYAKELGNTELALEQYKLLTEAKDADLNLYQRYVELASGSSNHALTALAVAKNALTRWPDDAGALTLAAQAAFAAGLPQDAQKYIESALKIDPKNPKALETEAAIKKATLPQKTK